MASKASTLHKPADSMASSAMPSSMATPYDARSVNEDARKRLEYLIFDPIRRERELERERLRRKQEESLGCGVPAPSLSCGLGGALNCGLPTFGGSSRKKGDAAAGDEIRHDPLAHLPLHEQDIINRQLEIPPAKINYFTLFRYANRTEIIILVLSALCAITAGAILPLLTIVFGTLVNTFKDFYWGSLDKQTFLSKVDHKCLYFIYLAIGEFVTQYVATMGFIYAGDRIAAKTRQNYLRAILRQNIGFFDKLGAGEITTRITADTNLIQDGVSEKIGLTLTALANFVTAFVIAFARYWLLAFIMSSTVAAIVVVMAAASKYIVLWNKNTLDAYAEGGTVAEEVLSSIRNANAFSTQARLANQYDSHLKRAEYWGFRHKSLLGFLIGILTMILYLLYGLGFWQGSRFLVKNQGGVDLSVIVTVCLAVMIGAFALGNVAPNVQAFTTAIAAANKIYSTIDRQSPLDPESDKGQKLENLKGELELYKIRHIYPSRPEVVVMEDVNLKIPANKTTALVGASGSGKSTIVGLVERFYDPVGGQVCLDGVDLRDVNIRWLRQQISLVSQEPTLFSTTIYGNIEHGLIGTEHEYADEETKKQLIFEAAKMANADNFIRSLPEGYETNVGERGFLLSGGQKQRIAIARAVVSNPKILLLDEATSALDTKSEGVVQAALDRAAKGRTTIVIAHRLSTIKTADNIVVMSAGRIVEEGTHDQLIEKQGAYFNLVEAQKIASANEERNMDIVNDSDSEISTTKDSLEKSAADEKSTWGHSRDISSSTYDKDVEMVTQVLEMDPESGTQSPRVYGWWDLIKTVASFNRQEWPIMLTGLIASMIIGGGQPTQAVFFAKCVVALSRPPWEYTQLRNDVNYWCWFFLMLAFVQLIANIVQGVAFAFCSEKLIHRARDKAFKAMLRQEIGFFDREENSAGALTSFLSTETTHTAGLSGVTLGTLLNVITCLISTFILSLIIGWKLALVCIAIVPVTLACGLVRFKILASFQGKSRKAYEKSASYACEATSAIRTVASLTREEDVHREYARQLSAQGKASVMSFSTSAILYAFAESFMFLAFALGMWYGAKLLANREYSLFQFFTVFIAVIFGSQSAGTVFSFTPDMTKAKNATAELKALFDRVPDIDSWSPDGTKVPAVTGKLEFSDVHFRYPTRPEQSVLRGLNLTVQPGQYVALVGASGCGKSTTIGLLERFYDPVAGSVRLDGRDISSLNITDYRRHLALVSQEPTLYQGTIRDNILLGSDAAPESVGQKRIDKACRDANIYNFITSLPDGFDTVVGNKGVMLSGGQKQRIAIARALLRDPKVLLLDEATSALDSESEKIVQAALDKAAKGRTTVAVAHRLSTIQRADCIFVFEGGVVVEKGTHAELMKRRGRYFELVSLQSLEKSQ